MSFGLLAWLFSHFWSHPEGDTSSPRTPPASGNSPLLELEVSPLSLCNGHNWLMMICKWFASSPKSLCCFFNPPFSHGLTYWGLVLRSQGLNGQTSGGCLHLCLLEVETGPSKEAHSLMSCSQCPSCLAHQSQSHKKLVDLWITIHLSLFVHLASEVPGLQCQLHLLPIEGQVSSSAVRQAISVFSPVLH